MAQRVVIVDYGAGNMGSILRATQHCGYVPELASDAAGIVNADRLILPGVGAFGPAMDRLREKGLVDPIRQLARSGRPLLGICLGMQMLADSSEEFGLHDGIGLIAGNVVPLPRQNQNGDRIKVPNIGWCSITRPQERDWSGTPLETTADGDYFYFVHSFQFVPKASEHVLSRTVYDGNNLTAAVRQENICGVQFHPEKSGEGGLSILKSFLR
jgi:glutamine amidotransferase